MDCDDADASVTDCSAGDITAQGTTLLALPSGTFDMGCTASQSTCGGDESPAHDVTLTRGFWLGETEVTQGQWQALMASNPSWADPSSFSTCGSDCPLEIVNWWEALACANAVSAAEGPAECYTVTGCTSAPGSAMECTGVAIDSATGSVYDRADVPTLGLVLQGRSGGQRLHDPREHQVAPRPRSCALPRDPRPQASTTRQQSQESATCIVPPA